MRTGAFFDVDDTLIAVPSVFRFLAHRLRDRPGSEYAAAYERVRAARASFLPKSDETASLIDQLSHLPR